jgi:hypothetical protein
MVFIYFFLNIIIAIMLVLKKNSKKKFFPLIILFPLFLSIFYNSFIIYNDSLNQNLEKKIYSNIIIKETFLRKSEENNFSSNRFQNWSKIISASDENYFMGFGLCCGSVALSASSAASCCLVVFCGLYSFLRRRCFGSCICCHLSLCCAAWCVCMFVRSCYSVFLLWFCFLGVCCGVVGGR